MTLDEVGWQNSTLLEGDLAEAVGALAKPGKNIGMSGSATLVRSLLAHQPVDELRLLVHPLVVGKGGRLFENGIGQVPLELVESRTFAPASSTSPTDRWPACVRRQATTVRLVRRPATIHRM